MTKFYDFSGVGFMKGTYKFAAPPLKVGAMANLYLTQSNDFCHHQNGLVAPLSLAEILNLKSEYQTKQKLNQQQKA